MGAGVVAGVDEAGGTGGPFGVTETVGVGVAVGVGEDVGESEGVADGVSDGEGQGIAGEEPFRRRSSRYAVLSGAPRTTTSIRPVTASQGARKLYDQLPGA